ncbi:MAG: MFS transporter [Chloroflexota bacterium]
MLSAQKKKTPTYFYGWVMLGVATITSILTLPGQTAGVSLFTPSFEEALNLSRTQQTGAYAMGTFLASLAMTYVGAQMDRYGIKRVMTVIVIAFGIACVYTGFVTGFWTLFIAFFFLRMLGQGSLTLVSSNTAAMWFDKRLGLTQAVLSVGFSLASAGMPAFAFWLIERFGWRLSYPILGLIVVGVLLPIIAFVFVDRPEDIGQLRDGGVIQNEVATFEASNRDFTLQEAMQTRAYWLVAAMMFAVSMIVTAFTFNSLFLFESFGLTNAQIVQVLAVLGTTQAVTQLGAGWLADVFSLRWLAVINMIGHTASMLILLFVQSLTMALLFAFVSGLFVALHAGIVSPLWARYYGLTHLGKIRGSIFTAGVAGSSLGPFVMGALFDLSGSYTPSIIIFMVIYAGLAFAMPLATRPVRKF